MKPGHMSQLLITLNSMGRLRNNLKKKKRELQLKVSVKI
jgi:hypothetical protein